MHTVTLLDGGMGQELVRRSGKPPTPLWSASILAEQPALVEALHVDFIKAGAEIITVSAYSCTPERLARHADISLFPTLQHAACQVAERARDSVNADRVQIAGCLPPLVASYHPELAPDSVQSLATYRQICEIQSSYVDLFLCETMASLSEALAAGTAACETGKAVWVALTLADQQPEHLRSGEPLRDVVLALQELPLRGLLLNCSRPETITRAWPILTAATQQPVGAYANGFTDIDSLAPGGTVNCLEARMDLGPVAYAEFARNWVDQGAAMIGGCCEVGPAHIAQLRADLDAAGRRELD